MCNCENCDRRIELCVLDNKKNKIKKENEYCR